MSSNSIVRRIAWISIVPQLLIIYLLIAIFNLFVTPFRYACDLALLFYLGAFLLLRNLIPRNHRKGVRLFKAGNYTQAIIEFQKSYDFFIRHPWIDRYRFIVLLSSSRLSYTEMALVNAAFCYAQTGNGQKAAEYYERTLRQFPDSEIAKSGLNMLHALHPDASGGQDS